MKFDWTQILLCLLLWPPRPPNRCCFLSLLLFALLLSPAAAQEPLRIHFISGSNEYKSESSLKILKQLLEEKHGAAATASWVKDGAQSLPEIEQVSKADLLVVFARRLKLPEEQLAVVRKHWESGKPVIGIRTASHAFSNEVNGVFDREVLGGNYKGHFGGDPVEVRAASETAAGHPVLKEVGEIVSTKLYKAGPLAEDALLLQNGTIKKNETHAVTWVHEYAGGRMFYTSLGVPQDFENEHFLRMLVNAVYWTTQREPK